MRSKILPVETPRAGAVYLAAALAAAEAAVEMIAGMSRPPNQVGGGPPPTPGLGGGPTGTLEGIGGTPFLLFSQILWDHEARPEGGGGGPPYSFQGPCGSPPPAQS